MNPLFPKLAMGCGGSVTDEEEAANGEGLIKLESRVAVDGGLERGALS